MTSNEERKCCAFCSKETLYDDTNAPDCTDSNCPCHTPSQDGERKEEKTIGDMIAELEDEMAAIRKADAQINLWKILYENAPEQEKKGMLITALKEMAGFTDDEINKILK